MCTNTYRTLHRPCWAESWDLDVDLDTLTEKDAISYSDRQNHCAVLVYPPDETARKVWTDFHSAYGWHPKFKIDDVKEPVIAAATTVNFHDHVYRVVAIASAGCGQELKELLCWYMGAEEIQCLLN